jgi:hypothetical protein
MFKAVIANALKELVIPELDKIKADVSETKPVLGVTNKRIDDLSLQMVEVNRRIERQIIGLIAFTKLLSGGKNTLH